MKKIILTLAVAALSATVVSQTQAAPKVGGPGNSSISKSQVNSKPSTNKSIASAQSFRTATPAKFKDYHVQHGTKFQHGVFYRGKHHEHWGHIRWDARYGCNCYWDPCLSTWYYWCQRDICYYPVSYCPYRCYTCTEVVVVPQPIIVRPICVECRPIIACNACASVLPGVVLRVGCDFSSHRVGWLHHSFARR